MLYPIIDIGSNTVKLAILDEEKLFSSTPIFFKAVPLNLKNKTENNALIPKAIDELSDLIEQFRLIAARLTKTTPLAFATASLRGLENTDHILRAIREKSGIEVDIISGEEEAYCSFLGARGSLHANAGIVVDLGGGSTEIISFRKNQTEKAISLPFGCLTLYQQYFSDGIDRYGSCCNEIRRLINEYCPPTSGNSILLTGGSAKAVLKYKSILEDKKSNTIGIRQLKRIHHHYRSGKECERKRIASILKDRYRLVPAAVAVFSQILSFYKKEQVFVCRSGVREGYLCRYLEKIKKN